MDDDVAKAAATPRRPDLVRGFRIHLLAYAGGNGVLFLIDLMTAGSWWFLWPVLGWGLAVAAHWLYVRSVNVDDDWAERRTEDLRTHAYDFSHIDDIKKRRDPTKSRRRLSSRSAPPSNSPS